jgi:hypothetical protein
MAKREPQNPYTPTRANDASSELVQIIIEYYRSHRAQFTTTEATNVGAVVTSILNGTYRV